MLRSYLLLFMLQGSLALTCYNSTRVTESHKIEYKSHETSEQACADACTANDKCIAYLSNENGGKIECVQFGPAKEIMCTLPIFINMKVACPAGVEYSSLCIPYPSVLPAKMAEETYVINESRLPKSIVCVSNNCTCPSGQIVVAANTNGCVTGPIFSMTPTGGWALYGTLSSESWTYLGKSSKLTNVRCETALSTSLDQQGNYNLPLVHSGFYGEKEIVCPKGMEYLTTKTSSEIYNANPDALRCNDEKGFVLENEPITYVICNK